MSLRWKLLIVVLATSLAFSGVTYVIQQLTVLPEFAAVELAEARADVSRGLYALRRDTEFLASCAADYGAWDDTYRFVQHPNEDYAANNLIPESFKNLRLNLLAVVRSDGTLVWASCARWVAASCWTMRDCSRNSRRPSIRWWLTQRPNHWCRVCS